MKQLILSLCLFYSLKLPGQQLFLNQGKIEYECKMNLHKQMEGDWAEEFKDKIAKFKTTYFDLYFKDAITIYQIGRESEEKVNSWIDGGLENDVVFTDLQNGTFVRKKQVFEQQFLIADSIRNVEWRITNELRDIAGFTCRKAVGRLLDSIYVVAFYAEEITVSGGPLSFAGLPGMILGLAIPRMSTTWFATKLELIEPKPSQLVPPTKGKKVNYKELQETIKKTVSDWGKWGARFTWQVML